MVKMNKSFMDAVSCQKGWKHRPNIMADTFGGAAGFYHSVASGDPLSNAVILWMRYTPVSVAWRGQTAEAIDLLNAVNPIEPGQPGYFSAGPEFFETYIPDYGAAYLYDAVMATGLGACLAGTGNITDEEHLQGIRSVDFQSASGRLVFGNDDNRLGSRRSSTVIWGILNFLSPEAEMVNQSISTFSDVTYMRMERGQH